MTSPPRLGVIGVGVFGLLHLRAFRQAQRAGKCELVCAAATSRTRLDQRCAEFGIRGYTDWREMLDRELLDAVSIVTPDHLHREQTLAALERGLHVLVEKPLDVTVPGGEEMIRAANVRERLLQVDFHKRYDPWHLELKRKLDRGELGALRYASCHMEDQIVVPRDWFAGWAQHSSPVWFLGVHFFDLMRWLMSSEPTRVFASGMRGKLTALGIDSYDAVQTLVQFANGASCTFDNSWILPDNFEAIVNQGLRIVGTEGVVEVDTQDRGMRGCTSAEGMRTFNMGYVVEATDRRGQPEFRGYGIESISDFVDNLLFLREGGTIEQLRGRVALGEDGLAATRMAVAAHRSVETGEVVDVSGSDQGRKVR